MVRGENNDQLGAVLFGVIEDALEAFDFPWMRFGSRGVAAVDDPHGVGDGVPVDYLGDIDRILVPDPVSLGGVFREFLIGPVGEGLDGAFESGNAGEVAQLTLKGVSLLVEGGLHVAGGQDSRASVHHVAEVDADDAEFQRVVCDGVVEDAGGLRQGAGADSEVDGLVLAPLGKCGIEGRCRCVMSRRMRCPIRLPGSCPPWRCVGGGRQAATRRSRRWSTVWGSPRAG